MYIFSGLIGRYAVGTIYRWQYFADEINLEAKDESKS